MYDESFKCSVMFAVDRICTTKSTDCRSLNKAKIARELLNLAHVPFNANITEIPLDWNNQVVILFLLPDDDKNYYSLFAGIGEDNKFHFDLTIAGTFGEDGYFNFFDDEIPLENDYFYNKSLKKSSNNMMSILDFLNREKEILNTLEKLDNIEEGFSSGCIQDNFEIYERELARFDRKKLKQELLYVRKKINLYFSFIQSL